MARAPDKRIEQAKQMYLQGRKLVEIASQLNIPEGTVRRWKCTHKWENERSNEKSERSKKRKKAASRGTEMRPGRLGIRMLRSMDSSGNTCRRKHRRSFQRLNRLTRWIFYGIRFRSHTLPLYVHSVLPT